MRFRGIIILSLTLTATWGCTPHTGERPIRIVAPADLPATYHLDDLTAVLRYGVSEQNNIEPRDFADADYGLPAKLDRQLALFAKIGPTTAPKRFSTPDERLAYWYNARAAWAIKLAMLKDCPEELSGAEFEERTFPPDGRRMTLADIDRALSREADWRIVTAAPCTFKMRQKSLCDWPQRLAFRASSSSTMSRRWRRQESWNR